MTACYGVLVNGKLTSVALHDDGALDVHLHQVDGIHDIDAKHVTPEQARTLMSLYDYPIIVGKPEETS